MRFFLTLGLSLLALTACNNNNDVFGNIESFDPENFEGVWASKGYGQVSEFSKAGLRNFSVTDKTCVAEPTDEFSGIEFMDLIRRNSDGKTIRLSSTLDPFEYEFVKVTSLKDICPKFTPDTPLDNFDAFADFFQTHYGFFDLYGVDWEVRQTEFRAKITDQTTDQELFDIMQETIAPLADSHIGIDAIIDGEEAEYDANPGKTEIAIFQQAQQQSISESEAIGNFRRDYWVKDIHQSLLGGEGQMAANGRIQYGMVADEVGYIAIPTMGGFVDGDLETLPQELEVLGQVLDDALTLFEDKAAQNIIIDISLNTGGYDFVGLAIADRFAGVEKITAFSKRPYDWPEATPYNYILGAQSETTRFSGNVYVLTSDLTVSAGEMVPLALRGLPHATIVGQKTRGAFSTVLNKYLPNGWKISLSNEIYNDRAGNVWEGKGVPPDIELVVFDPENPSNGHVEAVRAAVALIKK